MFTSDDALNTFSTYMDPSKEKSACYARLGRSYFFLRVQNTFYRLAIFTSFNILFSIVFANSACGYCCFYVYFLFECCCRHRFCAWYQQIIFFRGPFPVFLSTPNSYTFLSFNHALGTNSYEIKLTDNDCFNSLFLVRCKYNG